MSADLAKHYLQPTALTVALTDRRQLNTTTPSGGADTGTSVQYPTAGNGERQFRPGTANDTTAVVFPPASTVPTHKWGWRQNVDESADKVVTIAGNWPVSARFTVTGQTTGPSGGVTFIAYLVSGGVDTTYTEIGRSPNLPTGAAWAGGILSGDIAATAVTGPLNSRVEIQAYLTILIAAVSLGAVTISISTNSVDSFLDGGLYSLLIDRTASETVPRPVDSPVRAVGYIRRTSETFPIPADTTVRVTAYVRRPSEAVASPADSPSRVATYPRTATEVLPVPADTPRRVATYSRAPSETVAVPADSPRRTLAYARTINEAVAVPTDTPRRVMAYTRIPTEAVPVPVDSPSRQTTFRREPGEVVLRPVDTPSRIAAHARIAADVLPAVIDTPFKLVTYGRVVSHAFAESVPCPPCPPGVPPKLILVDGEVALRVGGKLYQKV